MYTVAVRRDFIAQHYLIGGDWGAENELPEFEGLNPSIEHFARILCRSLAGRLKAPNLAAITVKIWENEIAWARYRLALPFSPAGGMHKA